MRPRERLLDHGATALSLAELLSLIIGTGTRETDCLALAESLLRDLDESAWLRWITRHPESLRGTTSGLGVAKTARILAALEIGRRLSAEGSLELEAGKPADHRTESDEVLAETIPPHLVRANHEWIGVIPLRPRPGALHVVETGGRHSVRVDARDLFGCLLWRRCESFALVHNHPSGDLRPSMEDLALTENVKAASLAIGLGFAGHWIVGKTGMRKISA